MSNSKIDWSDVTKLQTREGHEIVAVFDSHAKSRKLVVVLGSDGGHTARIVQADTGQWCRGESSLSDIIPKPPATWAVFYRSATGRVDALCFASKKEAEECVSVNLAPLGFEFLSMPRIEFPEADNAKD